MRMHAMDMTVTWACTTWHIPLIPWEGGLGEEEQEIQCANIF